MNSRDTQAHNPNAREAAETAGLPQLLAKVGLAAVAALAIVAIGIVQLTISMDSPDIWTFMERRWLIVANALIVFSLFCVTLAATGRIGASLAATSLILTVLAIVNCYTLELHGAPLCYTELRNAHTAFAVLGNYNLVPPPAIGYIVAWGLLGAGIAFAVSRVTRALQPPRPLFMRLAGVILLALSLGLIFAVSFASNAPASLRYSIIWSRTQSVCEYGYPCFLAADAAAAADPTTKPDPYDTALVDAYLEEHGQSASKATDGKNRSAQHPDVIVILNETFFDLCAFGNIKTDKPCLDDFYGIAGAHFGSTVVTGKGGGTNDTEFELLTSNALGMLKVCAPFNYFDFTKCHDNNVSYLQSLGYHTTAFHVADPGNYNRNAAYPALGFDDVYLGREEFPACTGYGMRPWDDAGCYAKVLEELDSCGDEPQFMYLLTYQNHGGWDQNEAELDTIHVKGTYGYSSDELNEYLTSVTQSAEAFADFIDALRHRDRDTIVFMMGDHAPSFIGDIEMRDDAPYPLDLTCRATPCVVWSNFDIDATAFDGQSISVVDAIPLVLDAARIPESPYQQTIVDIHQNYPVRTNMGTFLDADGTYGAFKKDEAAQRALALYNIMEYNAVTHGSDYRADWFAPVP